MGGEDSVRVVQDLIGHAQHFDFAQVSERVPKLDLPDLLPFFRLALRFNRRQGELSVGLRNSETVALRDPIMPVTNGFSG